MHLLDADLLSNGFYDVMESNYNNITQKFTCMRETLDDKRYILYKVNQLTH